jgi:hypothetical protein
LDYDNDDSELHYKFTAFGRWKPHLSELFPWYAQDVLLWNTGTSVLDLLGFSNGRWTKCVLFSLDSLN